MEDKRVKWRRPHAPSVVKIEGDQVKGSLFPLEETTEKQSLHSLRGVSQTASMFLHRAMRYYRLWIYSCNLVLLVSVVAFVSLAGWVVSDYRLALFPAVDLRHPSLLYAYVALALQGGVLQAIGCLGAVRMSERLLHTYWSLLLLLLCGDVVLGAVWLARFHALQAGLRDELRTRLSEGYGAADPAFQLLWDRVQGESGCCGVDGPGDFATAAAWQRPAPQLVPRSCCRLRPAPREPRPLNASCVEAPNDSELVHPDGCYKLLESWLRRAADALCVLGFCVLTFLKLCFLGILRYEIREMIQKIRVLRDMSESPGLLDPAGPASLLPGTAMATKQRRPPNGNNNEADPPPPPTSSSSPKKTSSPV